MPTIWRRKTGVVNITSAATLGANVLIYQNSREQSGNITLVQKATVVATYLWALTDTDNTWSMTLLVDDESAAAPTFSNPEVDQQGGSDPQIKGWYPFGRGPVQYSPARLISIPSESKLQVRINKEVGGDASLLRYSIQFLIQTSL